MKKISIFASVGVALGIGLLLITPNVSKQTSQVTPDQIHAQKQEISFQVSIEGFFNTPRQDMAIDGTTLLGYLEALNQNTPALNLGVKKYEGLGSLVEQLGDKKNGQDGNYWQYSVNGKTPLIGADAYVLVNGDSVQWEFKKSEF